MTSIMISTITCPSCGKAIEVTQALVHQVQEELLADIEKKHKQELEQTIKTAEDSIKKQLQEKTALEITDLKKQITESQQKVTEMRQEELRLREEKRKLEDAKKDMELEVARKVDQEKKKVEESVYRQVTEQHRLKELEKEKVISDLRKALDDAQRKAQQGSQQTQGEVAELDIEQLLRQTFPTDTISPVEKGVKGADIRQVVKTTIGNVCGTILWESKRTKSWSQDWVRKLKDDLRAEKANIPIIISTVLPEEASNGFGFIDGVYVVSPLLVTPIASVLRQKLIDVAREKFIIQNKEGSSEKLYEYVTSHEFRQHIEAIVEVYKDMQVQVLKERAAFEKIWKTREAQVQKLFTSTAGFVGTMSGVIGQSFPTVKGLELLEEEAVSTESTPSSTKDLNNQATLL